MDQIENKVINEEMSAEATAETGTEGGAVREYHDRIAEAYEGLLGEEFMKRQKERIDWICQKAGSGAILDVGCSQGTCPLLLGRGGEEVTGIDIDPEAIRYATGKLLDEPVEVQSRVRYFCADFLSMELPADHYDAVLLTEILEHLEEPERFIDKAFSLLRDGGRMVVTVPFGFNTFRDHKRTYYMSELYTQLSARMAITDIEFFDGWIGYLAQKNTEGALAISSDIELIAKEEKAFFGIEQKRRGIEQSLREELKTIKQSRLNYRDKVLDLSDKLKDRKEAETTLKAELGGLKKNIADHEAALASAQTALQEKDAALQKKDTALQEKDAAMEKMLQERTALLQEKDAVIAAMKLDSEKQGETLLSVRSTLEAREQELQSRTAALASAEDQLKNETEALGTTETQLRKTKEKLQAAEKQLKAADKKTEYHQERSKVFSSELTQTRRKLETRTQERNDLQQKFTAMQKEYQELLDTPAGFRAHVKLLKLRFREQCRQKRAERKEIEGGWLRRTAKKIPFLVRIVKKIRKKYPESEFLYLDSSRAENNRGDIHRARSVPQKRKNTAVGLPTDAEINTSEAATVPERETPRVMTHEQEHFLDSLLPMIQTLPESNGSRYYEKSDLQIGIICDEFFYDSINAAAQFVTLEPTDWKDKLPGLNVLLIVSLWHGLHEEWNGAANPKNRKRRDTILEMIAEAKRLGIPTVFYSKEDPPNYERFIEYAQACDHIFTTAEECIPDYIRDTGNPEPRALCFSVNPLFHNPVGFRKFEKERAVLFSGSWMAKYPDRCRDMSMLFDGVLSAGCGLHIIDRNYPSNSTYPFPSEYFPYVSPAMDHATLQKVHKLFDWAINTNSVQFSKTMFANRAYELQAAGVLLLSNYSLGVNSRLPNVFMAFSSEEVRDILIAYTPEETYERQIAGIRSVLRNDTCYDRMDELYEAIGMPRQQKTRRIAVIGDADDVATTESFARQTFPEKALLPIKNITDELLRDYDMVAFFGPGMHYGEFYLEDMANGFKYTASDYITKSAWYEGGVLHDGTEHDYVTVVGSRFRTLFWREAFSVKTLLELADGAELPNGYSIDHFNYDACPEAKPIDERVTPYKLSVVVPVYNNGAHLYGKCFSSLRRSSIFEDMEILLVDDGSTDGVTPKYVSYLANRYNNVRAYFFETGGSGSASRPRNKGVEMATAEYLTFLDPDNEASEDGYAKLLESTEDGLYELAVGGHLRAGLAIDKFSSYRSFSGRFGTDKVTESIPNIVSRMKFPTISIQAAVIRKALITRNGLEQVPGAAGQDTLFGWQLLQAAKSQRFLNLSAHVYYAATAGSVTNTITVNYFRKLWLLQEPKLTWLQSSGNLEPFMKNKYAYYTDNLIFKKLASVRQGDEAEAIRIVWDYVQLYAPYFHGTDEMIARFSDLCACGAFPEALEYVKACFSQETDEGLSR